jgi:hypothetical protein
VSKKKSVRFRFRSNSGIRLGPPTQDFLPSLSAIEIGRFFYSRARHFASSHRPFRLHKINTKPYVRHNRVTHLDPTRESRRLVLHKSARNLLCTIYVTNCLSWMCARTNRCCRESTKSTAMRCVCVSECPTPKHPPACLAPTQGRATRRRFTRVSSARNILVVRSSSVSSARESLAVANSINKRRLSRPTAKCR